jgi:CheY-like chemotaxis protein
MLGWCFWEVSVQILEPKLLIADDDRDFRESLSEVFCRRGYTTCLAADGQEALEIVKSSRELHLVILDIHMPRLGGLEALQQLRWSRASSLPCILMSAQMDESIVREAEPLMPASMLSKPFTLRTLTTTVETVLRNSYGWKI